MPPPTNPINESISHLAERVAGIASTLHLFEEKMKSLTSSLGRMSALLLLQAGIPIGPGSIFNSASFLMGRPGSQGNRTQGILASMLMGNYAASPGQQMWAAQNSQGGMGGAGANDLHGMMMNILPKEAKSLVDTMAEVNKAFKETLVEALGGHMGIKKKYVPSPEKQAQADALLNSGNPLVYVDTEYGDGYNVHQVGSVGKRGSLQSYLTGDLPPTDSKYHEIVAPVPSGAKLVDPKTALADLLSQGGIDMNALSGQSLWDAVKKVTWAGHGMEANPLNQLWGQVFQGTSTPLSPFDAQNTLDTRNLSAMVGAGGGGSIQAIFEKLFGEQAIPLLAQLRDKHQTGKIRGEHTDHQALMDAEMLQMSVEKARGGPGSGEAPAPVVVPKPVAEILMNAQDRNGGVLTPVQSNVDPDVYPLIPVGGKPQPARTRPRREHPIPASMEMAEVMKDLLGGEGAAGALALQQILNAGGAGPNIPAQVYDVLPPGAHPKGPLTTWKGPAPTAPAPEVYGLENKDPFEVGVPSGLPPGFERLVEVVSEVQKPQLSNAGLGMGKGSNVGTAWGDNAKQFNADPSGLANTLSIFPKLATESQKVVGAFRGVAVAGLQLAHIWADFAKAGSPDAFDTMKGQLQILSAVIGANLLPQIMKLSQVIASVTEFVSNHQRVFTGAGSSPGMQGAIDWTASHTQGSAAGALFSTVANFFKGGGASPIFSKEQLSQATMLSSVRTTPQYSGLEDTYKKVQLDILGKSPIEKLLDEIHEGTLKLMLDELKKQNENKNNPNPFGLPGGLF